MASPKPPTARQRARTEFTAEIKAVARRQLAEHGAPALSLRAVARELGLASASALYRYFPGRDALLTALIVDSYTALGDAACAAAEPAPAAPADDSALERWVRICHAVRDWALAHPHEYALIYGSPVPGYAAPPDTIAPGTRIPYLIGALFTDPPGGARAADRAADGDRPALPDEAAASMAPLLADLPPGTPAGLVMDSLTAWTHLFGAVSFDLFGHRSAIVSDPRAFFDHEVRRLGAALGLAA